MELDKMKFRVINLLDNKGDFEWNGNPWDALIVYEDVKILLQGRIDVKERKYLEFLVHIKMSDDQNSGPLMLDRPFQLARHNSEDDLTLVFQCELEGNIVHYYRPGKWEMYLSALVDKMIESDKELREINGQPIDDKELFS